MGHFSLSGFTHPFSLSHPQIWNFVIWFTSLHLTLSISTSVGWAFSNLLEFLPCVRLKCTLHKVGLPGATQSWRSPHQIKKLAMPAAKSNTSFHAFVWRLVRTDTYLHWCLIKWDPKKMKIIFHFYQPAVYYFVL